MRDENYCNLSCIFSRIRHKHLRGNMKKRLGWTSSNMADNTDKPKGQTVKHVPWCKSLKSLPVFTRKEKDEHRNNSPFEKPLWGGSIKYVIAAKKKKADKVLKPILKTLKRGLKKDHHLGYYTQVQLVLGFCGLEWVDFVVNFVVL